MDPEPPRVDYWRSAEYTYWDPDFQISDFSKRLGEEASTSSVKSWTPWRWIPWHAGCDDGSHGFRGVAFSSGQSLEHDQSLRGYCDGCDYETLLSCGMIREIRL